MATAFHRRPGVTVEQLQGKRQALLDQLHSAEHEASVITRDYGGHDPRIAPFPACACGSPGRLEKTAGGKWTASCAHCEKKIRDPQQTDWAACLQWCLLNLEQLDYQALPLFGLAGLDRQGAKARIASIYQDLLLRCQVATLDLSINQRTHTHLAPGQDYFERLCAYRDWAKLILRLLKFPASVQAETACQ